MVLLPFVTFAQSTHNSLQINELDYFETTGVNVLVFSNWYDGNFSDSKISSIEIIHHGVRTATNGDVRFNPTPEQWDTIPKFLKREIDRENNRITAYLTYPDYNFDYKIQAEHRENGLTIAVALDKPLPNKLKGVAGFNLEFLPAAYFEKSYLMDGKPGFFPLSPAGPMKVDSDGHTEPLPLAMGKRLILAPEDPMRRISVSSQTAELSLYDGRNKAQNGWFVLRELLPGNKTGKVIEWTLEINSISSWIREPGIRYSQVGYHPKQQKVAVIELDKNDTAAKTAKLLKISSSGNMEVIFENEPKSWGNYLRYKYYTFDFSRANTEGLYAIEYSGTTTKPFRIGEDVFSNTWQPTLDVFFPVQMAHMTVNEAYRVWHGAAHLDDALQAPVNHEHFDLYAQGPTTDSPYQPGEHIPGLNIGGWFDAGDYDIRTQTQYYVILNLVQIWERFGINRDETLVDYPGKFVDMHHPDGKADILQQIEHGTLALLAQHRSVGHAIAGIIVPDLSQYTHLGDALTMTDNLIYKPD
ncbi:glycoside hydrolase family 9 protein, partial [candidate division KSB1 bacterium]|nr:glycoside hydrolase family 9 protein [candidate division KSB1 bacterium]